MEYGYGTVGNTSVHHIVLGGWKGEPAQFGNQKVNHPACASGKRCARRIVSPDPDRMCQKCVRILSDLERAEKTPAPVVLKAAPVTASVPLEMTYSSGGPVILTSPPAPEPDTTAERQFVTVKRRECFVVHPYQRDIMTPAWPKKWGEFSLEKFYSSLEPVTVIDASLVSGLKEYACEEHGADCDYDRWDEARYIVLGGQHRTQQGGIVFGPDWEFEAVELLVEARVTDLARRWWVTEDRRNPGTRVLFDKRVHDGDPDFVAMGEHLTANGFTWKRQLTSNGSHLIDFTSIGTLPVLWHRDEEAARTMVEVLGRLGAAADVRSGAGVEAKRLTRKTLVRAVFEMASWDLSENKGTHVRWSKASRGAGAFGSMAAKIAFLGSRVTYYENAVGVSGENAWQRVANSLAAQYNKGRSTGYVEFPVF